jgi:hypothetical protein
MAVVHGPKHSAQLYTGASFTQCSETKELSRNRAAFRHGNKDVHQRFSGKLRCNMAIHSHKYRKQDLPAVPALRLHCILLQLVSWQSIAIVSSYHTETSQQF